MSDTSSIFVNPAFAGFKPLKANFTQTPNQFFDRIVGNYHPCVVTVVAILIRATLGWEDPDTNERRAEADLPLSAFVRSELSESSARKGIAGAIEAGFMVQTVPATNRQSARYALRWDDPEQQKRALQKQRRAQGGMKRRGAAVMESKWKKRGATVTPLEIDNTAPEVRGATPRGLTVRGLTVRPPIYKESLKKSYSEKKEEIKEKKEETDKSFSLSLSQIAEQKQKEPVTTPLTGLVTNPVSIPVSIPVPEKPEVTCKTMLAFRKARREMSKEWFIIKHGRPSNEHDWMGAVIKAEAEAAAAEKGATQ